jgi:phosphoribosylformimino-5-aminoimidazole carboxamide ribotide isomerase
MIVIPAIDLKDGKYIRLSQGRMDQATVYSEDPVQMAKHCG